MEPSVWQELLGSFDKCVRGAILISKDGDILKSTLSKDDDLPLNTRRIATLISNQSHQIDIKTDSGWILAAPLGKQQILVVVIDSGPYTRFNLDLIKLFAEDSPSNNDSRLADPIIVPQPPKRGGTHTVGLT